MSYSKHPHGISWFAVSSLMALLACDDKGSNDVDRDAGGGGAETSPTTPGTPTEPGGDETDDLFTSGAPPVAVDDTDVDPAPTPAPAVADDPLVACPGAVAVGESPLIDDLEDGDSRILVIDNRDADWYVYQDDSGGSHTLSFESTDDPAVDGSGVLHVAGGPFDQYSGLGLGLRWSETGDERCYYDASHYEGLRFWARGDAGIRVALQMPEVRPVSMGGTCPDDAACYDSHGVNFDIGPEWTLYEVPFSSVTQSGWGHRVGSFDPSKLFTIEFQFTGGSTYDFWLDDLTFYGEDTAVPDAGASDAGTSDAGTSDAGAPPEPLGDASMPDSADASSSTDAGG